MRQYLTAHCDIMMQQPFARPTAFDELRYGFFDVAFGNILKAIRGGTNPIGVTTLAMCSVSALSEIQWTIDNPNALQATGELLPATRRPTDRELFEGWLNAWVRDTGINVDCDAPRTYGLRCALVHTGGGSEALTRTGVGAWYINTQNSANHYSVTNADVDRFNLNMPDFLAELILAADHFLINRKSDLEAMTVGSASRLRIGFLAIPVSSDLSTRLVNNMGSLTWFHKDLSASPLTIPKADLSNAIRDEYYRAVNAGLVSQ